MKSITSLNLDVSVVEALKSRAKAEGRSTSAVANDALGAFLRVQAPRPATPVLTRRARLVLGAVTELREAAGKLDVTKPGNATRYVFREYRLDEICRKVGDFPSNVFPALRECERAGVLICGRKVPFGLDEGAQEMEHWRLAGD